MIGTTAPSHLLRNRIEKGYGDKEYWYLKDNDLLDENAKVITIVHETQIMNDFSDVMNVMDVKVHYILTPKRIIVIKKNESR
jgi:5-formyltetrahydrofolate cyclo-ligase